MFVCDRRGISCLNRQCERYHVARGGQLTLYGSGLSLLLRLYVTVPGGRERMCENEPNYSSWWTVSPLWPLAAGRWPLAAGRWPLAAGRWSSRLDATLLQYGFQRH